MLQAHDHDHGAAGHRHTPPSGPGTERRLGWAIALTGGFTLVETVGGVLSGSLALLADAGHMLTDVGALLLALVAVRLARRPGDPRRTFGYARLEVLAAFVNGVALLALAAWILVEAALRLLDPVPVLTGPMLAVAVAGLVVNLASFAVLHGGAADSLNVRGALVHVLGDLLGSVAAIVAALTIHWTDWTPADPILSALVALLIVRSGWEVTRRSGHILLEGAPEGVDGEAVRRALVTLPGVEAVEHVHLWSLTPERTLASLHLRVAPNAPPTTLRDAKAVLREAFGIEHATIEVDSEA